MTILVTGGAGYIGSHTVRALHERGDRVVVVDNLSTGHAEALPRGVPLLRADIRDQQLVAAVIREHGVSAAIHFAAEKSVTGSMADPGATFDVNVSGTIEVLRTLAAADVDALVFSSSCAVYGTPAELPVDEQSPIRPDNPYGESKVMGERLAAWFGRCFGLRTISLRYFNAAGAHPSSEIGEAWAGAETLIPSVLRAAWTGDTVAVYGHDYPTPDGTAVRDFVHVMDVADAHLRALDDLADGGASATLNLGTGRGTSVRDVVDAARRVTGRDIATIDAPRRSGDPPAVWAATDRAFARIGWRARRDLEDMVASAWAWHSRHPDDFVTAPVGAASDGR